MNQEDTRLQAVAAWRLSRSSLGFAVLALLCLLFVLVRSPYTSGQFTDVETTTSNPIFMAAHETGDITIEITSNTEGVFVFTSNIPVGDSTDNPSPECQSFDLEAASPDLTDSRLCDPVDRGSYSITWDEAIAVDGWDLLSISCPGADADVDLLTYTVDLVFNPGESVVCTFEFEGEVVTGSLTVNLDYSDDSTDGLAVNVSCDAGASAAVDGLIATELVAAEFTIVDMPPAGTTCDAFLDNPPSSLYEVDDSDCQDISLTPVSPDDDCTITLTELGSITVIQSSPAGEDSTPVTFQLLASLSDCEEDPFTLTDGEDRTCDELPVGTYVIEQTPAALPLGWELSDIACDAMSSTENLGNGTVQIVLGVGEDVTCTFTNVEVP